MALEAVAAGHPHEHEAAVARPRRRRPARRTAPRPWPAAPRAAGPAAAARPARRRPSRSPRWPGGVSVGHRLSPRSTSIVGVDAGERRSVVGRRRRPSQHDRRCRRTSSAWSSSTRPCLNSSSTARKRTMTSSRSTSDAGEAAERDAPDAGQLVDQLARPRRPRWPGSGRRGRGRPAAPASASIARRKARLQVVGRDAGEQVGRRARRSAPRGRRVRGKRAAGLVGQPRERGGGVLERLALEQAGEQQVALLPQRQLVVEVDVVVARAAAGGPSARPAWRRSAGTRWRRRGRGARSRSSSAR